MAWRYVRTIPDAGSFQRDALREIVKGDAKPFRVLTTDEECPSLGSRPASAQPRRVAFFSDPSRLFKSDYERCRTRSSLCAPPIPDAMCARLSCAHNHTPASACNMTAARQGLARIEAVGLVDAYQESLCVFAALATDALPAFCDCENVTRWQSFVPRAPRPPTRSTSGLSASSRKSIEDRSRHDTALYVAAKERLIASARVLETRYGRRIWCEREGGTRLPDVTRVTNLPRPPSPLKFLHFPKVHLPITSPYLPISSHISSSFTSRRCGMARRWHRDRLLIAFRSPLIASISPPDRLLIAPHLPISPCTDPNRQARASKSRSISTTRR